MLKIKWYNYRYVRIMTISASNSENSWKLCFKDNKMLFLCTWLFLSSFELVLFFKALPLWQCCRAMYYFDIIGCFSFNVASPATSSGNGDINRTSGKVTKLKQGWLQLKNDTYLQIWSRFFLAMHSFDVFYNSRTNYSCSCSYRNPGL